MTMTLSRLRNSSIAKNAGWMMAGQGFSVVIQAAYFVLLARLLGSTQYGVYAGAAALGFIVSPYCDLGSGLLFLRHVSPAHEKSPQYWGNILIATFGTGTLFVALTVLTAHWTISSAGALLVSLTAIANCIGLPISTCAGQVFQAFEQMRYTAVLNLLQNALRLVLAGVMLIAIRRASALEWAWAAFAVSLAGVILSIVLVNRRFGKPRFSFQLFRSSLSEGFGFSFAGSTSSLYNDLDKAMLSHYEMNAANGIYSVAYRVINIATTPVLAIYSAAYPTFFRKGAEGIRSTASFAWKSLKHTLLVSAPAAVAMFFLAPLLPLMAGPTFGESASALRWLCLIPVFRSFHISAGYAMTGAGYQPFRTASQFLAAAFNFGLNLYLIPRYSWIGAAWASLATDGGLAVMNWLLLFYLVRRTSLRMVPVPSPAVR
ncbi:MAG: flippase [Alloacidobacterium sp.]|jgi:O-antigen/teichoic acid export membrane protein